jgi:hypothetical protein
MTPEERERRERERKERTEAELAETLAGIKRIAAPGVPGPAIKPTIKLDTSSISAAVPESLRTLQIDPAPTDDKTSEEAPPPAINRKAVVKGVWSSLNREEQADFIQWAQREDWNSCLTQEEGEEIPTLTEPSETDAARFRQLRDWAHHRRIRSKLPEGWPRKRILIEQITDFSNAALDGSCGAKYGVSVAALIFAILVEAQNKDHAEAWKILTEVGNLFVEAHSPQPTRSTAE